MSERFVDFPSGSAVNDADASATGFDPARLDRVYQRLDDWTRSGTLPAVGICVGRRGNSSEPKLFGRRGPEPDDAPIARDARFLVASITKPIVATAALQLIERGQLTLADRVVDFIPEFGCEGKYGVELRHLLTHTSGLPDMLPDNLQINHY